MAFSVEQESNMQDQVEQRLLRIISLPCNVRGRPVIKSIPMP